MGVDRDRQRVGDRRPLVDQLEIAVEEPEPRPLPEETDERTIVADGAGEDPAGRPGDRLELTPRVDPVELIGLVPGKTEPASRASVIPLRGASVTTVQAGAGSSRYEVLAGELDMAPS